MKNKIVYFITILVILVVLIGVGLLIIFPQKRQAVTILPQISPIMRNESPLMSVTPTPLSPVAQDHAPDLNNQYNIVNHPDIFLWNKTPFNTTDYSVTSEFTNTPTQHFFFMITLKSENAKQEFLTWLHGLGLTNQQIPTLDIRYQ